MDKQAKLQKLAQVRSVAAFTTAKALLPEAKPYMQRVLAANLLRNPTQVLTAMTKRLSVIATAVHLAEKFEEVHRVSLNEFIEDPSVLEKLKKEVAGEAKKDPVKVAHHATDESKCNHAQGEKCNHTHGEKCNHAPGEACEHKTSATKKADEGTKLDLNDKAIQDATAPDASCSEKLEAHNELEKLENEVQRLEEEVMATKEIDLGSVFNDDVENDKKAELANEDDILASSDDFFGPSSQEDMDEKMAANEGFFGENGEENMPESDGDVDSDLMADLFDKVAGAEKEIEALKGDAIPGGEFADEFQVSGDTQDVDSDNEDNLFADMFEAADQDEYPDTDRDTEPVLGKVASKKAPVRAKAASSLKRDGGVVRSLGDQGGAPSRNSEAENIARALFRDDI